MSVTRLAQQKKLANAEKIGFKTNLYVKHPFYLIKESQYILQILF